MSILDLHEIVRLLSKIDSRLNEILEAVRSNKPETTEFEGTCSQCRGSLKRGEYGYANNKPYCNICREGWLR